ncbi:unnamed protein product [Pylaiella littoralis]
MLAGRAGCSQPQSIEQARKDFKIYMSKLLEHSAALDTFRPETNQQQQQQQQQHLGVRDSGSRDPAWGPPLNGPSEAEEEEGGDSVDGGARWSYSAGGAPDVHPPMQPSPSFFQVEHTWPRAGAATSPRPRRPPNFCWAAEPPRTTPRADAGGGGGAARTVGSLFSDLVSPGPTLHARASGGGVGWETADDSNLTAVVGSSSGRRHGEDGEDGGGGGGGEGGDGGGGEGDSDGEDDGDEWKARWSRRFSRGPIHSEYQDRFPWPPRSAMVSTETRGGGASPARGRRTSAFASAAGTAGEVGAVVRGRAAMPPAPPARSASPLPLRRPGGGGGGGGDGAQEGGTKRNTGARGESEPPRGRRRAVGVSRAEARRRRGRRRSGVRSSPSAAVVDATGGYRDGERTGVVNKAAAAAAAAAAASRGGGGGGGGGGEQEEEEEEEAEAEEESFGAGAPWRGDDATVSPPPSDVRVSEWEVVGNNHARGGSDNGDSIGCDERGWNDGRGSEHGGGDGRPSRRAAVAGGSSSAEGAVTLAEPARESAEGVEVWRGQALGRGEVATMSGGRTLDYSCQSILTEYMDEFMWPSTLPVPGRRGERTGMGVDHVARLLAGKRAEEPRRVPDSSVVARLGAAADGALKAGSPGHLSEMCRLKSPSPACRRLVLGLVAALGLSRWRRWSDIRTHLLGNKPELLGFLRRFDKHRIGLSSAALRPYVEDPSLSPAEVKRVAACMVWVSRWLRALHNYLAAKEGNLDMIDTTMLESPAAPYSGRASRRRAHGTTVPRTVPRTAPGAVPEGGRKSQKAADDGRERGCGGSLVGDGRTRTRKTSAATAAAAAAAAAATGTRAAGLEARQHRNGVREEEDEDDDDDDQSRDTRRTNRRRPSQAAATRGDGSTCPPASSTTARGGDFEVRSRAGGGEGGKGLDGGARDKGGGGGSESQWTTGTVTSRGDVLGAPTEDQVDVGSSVAVWNDDKENARTVRKTYYGRGAGAGAGAAAAAASLSSVGAAAPSEREEAMRGIGVAAAASRTGNTTAFGTIPKGTRGSGGASRGLSRSTRASHACIYRHQPKARTPSRIANPNARQPTRARKGPILENTRWPPAVVVRACDRTEQRSAFSLEHSFLAYE